MRILMGHQSPEFNEDLAGEYDVRHVQHSVHGHRPASIAEMLAQCPYGWKPDVYLHSGTVHFPIPTDIDTFDGLTGTVISDWHRGGRAVWAGAGFFDLVLGERPACALAQANGHEHALFTRLWGADPAIHRMIPEVTRDIDVLFIGALNPSVWSERNRWLARLASLSAKYQVLITQGYYDDDYVRLTNRAKIVFNRSVNGCTNGRAYDGSVCGALVFNDDASEEPKEIFQDRVHCVYYNEDNFEDLIAYYLCHENERLKIVEAGRELVLKEHTNAIHRTTLYSHLAENHSLRGYRPYARLSEAEKCYRKAMQIYCTGEAASGQTALQLLDAAYKEGYSPAHVMEGRAAVTGWMAEKMLPLNPKGEQRLRSYLERGISFARNAIKLDSSSVSAHLGLAFLLIDRVKKFGNSLINAPRDSAEATQILVGVAEYCEGVKAGERTSDPTELDGFLYPHRTDLFDRLVDRAYLKIGANRLEWEQQLRACIAWRCRMELCHSEREANRIETAYRHAQAAVRMLPEEANAKLSLARLDLQSGKAEEAAEQYRQCLEIEPLLVEAWAKQMEAFLAAGRTKEALEFYNRCKVSLKGIPLLQDIGPVLEASLPADIERYL